MKMSIAARLLAGFVIALVVVVAVATLSVLGARLLLGTAQHLEHTHRVLADIDVAQADLIDLENGARAYVITGDSKTLAPHGRARDALDGHLKHLEWDAADNPEQAARIARLRVLVRQLTHHFARVVLAREQGNIADAAALDSERAGRATMDATRALVEELRRGETRELLEATDQARGRARLALGFILAGACAMLLLVGTAMLMLTRYLSEPLQQLQRAIERAGNHEPLGELPGGDNEIGAIAEALRQAAEARARTEAWARDLIELASDAVVLADLDGHISDVNAAACRLIGRPRAALVGERVEALVPEGERERLAAMRRASADSAAVVGEWSLLRADGGQVPVELSASRLPGGRWQAIVRDISERKRADLERQRLLEAEQRHHRRLQSIRESTLAISELDRVAAQQLPLVLRRICDEARRLTEADYAALGIGSDPDQPFDPWVWSGISDEVAARLGAHPRARGLLGWVARNDGALRLDDLRAHSASVGVPPHHPEIHAFLGVPIRAHGGSQDAHAVGTLYLGKGRAGAHFSPEDQALIELLAGHAAIAIENARLHDQLHAIMRGREEMLAVVSHDLKSPLNAIALREQMLRRHVGDDKLVAHADSIRRSIATMQRMIRGLLDSASLDAGQLKLSCERYPLVDIVDEVWDVYSPLAQERNLTFTRRVAGEQRIWCDRERLLQILANLVGNAVKFCRDGGDIVVSSERRDGAIVVAVSDNGPGITPEVLPRIFERYFTTERGHHGTGLGLHIARALVQAHGGRLWVESTVDQGATFYFSLPEADAKPSSAPE